MLTFYSSPYKGIVGVPPYIITDGLQVHLSGINTDSMTRTGNRVDVWSDLSGNGNHFGTSFAGVSYNPNYVASAFGGIGGLRFISATASITESAAALSSITRGEYTVFVVSNKASMFGFSLVHDITSNRDLLGNAHANRLGEFGSLFGAYGAAVNTPLVMASRNTSGTVQYLVNSTFYGTFSGSGMTGSTPLGRCYIGYGGAITNWGGDVGYVLIYNRALTNAEMIQTSQYFQRLFKIVVQPPPTAVIAFDGNSITFGSGTISSTYPSPATINAGLTEYDYLDFALGGQTSAQMQAAGATRIDPHLDLSLGAKNNIYVHFEMMNSLDAGQTVAQIKATVIATLAARKTAGWGKTIILTGLPRVTSTPNYESNRQILNAWVVAGGSGADLVADVGNDPTIGQDGDQLNVTYYPDGLHPSDDGHVIIASYVTPQIQAARA